MEEILNTQIKVITSLKVELDETRSMKEERESMLECSKAEAHKCKEEVRKWKAEVTRLGCRVQRFNENLYYATERVTYSHFCRFGGWISHAAEKAVEAKKASPNVLEVKDKQGVIKDWARETMAELTGVENIPASSSFRVFKKCATMTGKEVKGSWSRRSVSRVMCEVEQAAELLVVECFLQCTGLL